MDYVVVLVWRQLLKSLTNVECQRQRNGILKKMKCNIKLEPEKMTWYTNGMWEIKRKRGTDRDR